MYSDKYPHPRPNTKRQFKIAREAMVRLNEPPKENTDVRFAVHPETRRGPRKEVSVSFSSWLGTIFLMLIPVINIIVAIATSVSATAPPSKRTFARALLVVITILLLIIGIVIIVGSNMEWTLESVLKSLKLLK
jgi:hypothetical protein